MMSGISSFFDIEKNKTTNKQKTDFRHLPSCVESLPNELLFMIVAYLSSPDLIQAFAGLNYRFDLIVYELARHFTISRDTSEIDFDEYKLHIKDVVEKFSFDVQLLPQIFLSINSYTNLRSIIFTCSNIATVDLNVDCHSAKSVISLYSDILRVCSILPVDWSSTSSFSHDCNYLSIPKSNVQEEVIWNTLPCTAIVRLSIDTCTEQALLSLCALAPNLIYLKIKQLVSSDDGSNFNSILALIPQPSSLKQLYITASTNRLNNIYWVGRLIMCCQSSLERLTLEISLNSRPDGYHLQRILEPCRYLQKFTFTFNYLHEETEEIDALYQFQSEWWLDSGQPPVLIFCGNHSETLIVSMPSHLDDYIWFPVNPKDWLVNKGQLDSPDIRFTKQKSIRFVNTNHQPITLDLVHIIGHVFQAPKQELSIPHWEFVSPDLLIEQLINNTGRDPMLPLIYALDLHSCNLDQINAKTLIIWLLLAPNVKVLNICQGSTSAKIQLANRLNVLLEEDKRLKSITDSVEEVQVCYMFDSINYATKQHICQMYSNIFQKPVIRR